jgi:hypothetical protein
MSDTKNFLGIPVEGHIHRRDKNTTAQISKEEFGEILAKVIKDERVEAVKWRQYTPYFNDGDPCEFGVHEPTFKFTGVDIDPEDTDYGDGFMSTYSFDYHPELKKMLGAPSRSWKADEKGEWRHTPDDQEFARAVYRLSSTIEGGSAYDVLMDAFGDHAEITVYSDRIVVDEYSHD